MPGLRELLERAGPLSLEERVRVVLGWVNTLDDDQAETELFDWRGNWARLDQIEPPGDWLTWLILAGRGWGKKRTGGEWVREIAERHPACRIALVARTAGDVRDTMVEGESGILAISPRAVVLDAGNGEEGDAGETFERKPTPTAGYEGLLSKFDQRLAAAADMPVTLLMGQAPAGLNATGEADVIWWTEYVEGLQEEDLREPLNRLVRLILLSNEGPTNGKEPENWSVSFRPLRQLSPLQEAERRLRIAQADTTYTDAGVLMPEEVAVSRFGGDRFGEELAIDEELRRKMEETPKPDEDDLKEGDPEEK